MALAMNIDTRQLNRIFKDYAGSGIFVSSPDPFKTVSFRERIAEYIYDVRVKQYMEITGKSKEEAEETITAELEATESEEVL